MRDLWIYRLQTGSEDSNWKDDEGQWGIHTVWKSVRTESLGYVMTGNQIYDIDSAIVENKIDFLILQM